MVKIKKRHLKNLKKLKWTIKELHRLADLEIFSFKEIKRLKSKIPVTIKRVLKKTMYYIYCFIEELEYIERTIEKKNLELIIKKIKGPFLYEKHLNMDNNEKYLNIYEDDEHNKKNILNSIYLLNKYFYTHKKFLSQYDYKYKKLEYANKKAYYFNKYLIKKHEILSSASYTRVTWLKRLSNMNLKIKSLEVQPFDTTANIKQQKQKNLYEIKNVEKSGLDVLKQQIDSKQTLQLKRLITTVGKDGLLRSKEESLILYKLIITKKKNNTYICILNTKGDIIYTKNPGVYGHKKSKRRSIHCFIDTMHKFFFSLKNKIKDKDEDGNNISIKNKFFIIVFRGMSRNIHLNKYFSIIKKYKLKVFKVHFDFLLPKNGCRLKKKRRI